MQRWVQRAFLDQEPLFSDGLDPTEHAESVHRSPSQRLEDEEVERAAYQFEIGFRHGASSSIVDTAHSPKVYRWPLIAGTDRSARGCGVAGCRRILGRTEEEDQDGKSLKTQRNRSSVRRSARVADERKRRDAMAVSGIMQDITGEKPAMGTSMVGSAAITRYDSGQEALAARRLSPRKDSLTLYIMPGFRSTASCWETRQAQKGVSCLYIKSPRIFIADAETLIGVGQAHETDREEESSVGHQASGIRHQEGLRPRRDDEA
jgi:hypothetical protein